MTRIALLITSILVCGHLAMASQPKDGVLVHSMPTGEQASEDFCVAVAGHEVPVYIAKVAPLEKKLRFKAMDDKANSATYFDKAAFAYFDAYKPLKVVISPRQEVKSVKVLPSSAGVTTKIDNGKIELTIKPGQKLTVEINGDIIRSLHLFANHPEKNHPDKSDPNVIYYGPGVHYISRLIVRSNQTLYLAAGAVLRTILSEEEKKNPVVVGLKPQPYNPSITLIGENIKVMGRGIIDGSMCPTHARNMIVAEGSDITIDGIILRDAGLWTLPVRMSDNVHINDIKLIGYRANADGVDICNSTNVVVENCFIRTLDDLIVVKTLKGKGECKNIIIRRNVLWNEVAHALSIGAEIREDISNVLFSDCDIIHDQGREWALRIYHCDASRVKDVRFENIRIEECGQLISLWIDKGFWSNDTLRGHIDNVSFKNISAFGKPAEIRLSGYGESNLIRNITFDKVKVNGVPLSDEHILKNEYIKNIIIK